VARKIKSLSKEQINKNNSIELRHYIDKIKSQERKYTFILVIFFMILFCIIGYVTLTVNREVLIENVGGQESNNSSNTEVIVTLSKNDIINDIDGLSLDGNNISVENNSSDEAEYKVFFKQDLEASKSCGCGEKTISKEFIKYSTDGATTKNLSSTKEVLFFGKLEKGESRVINIKMWLDNSLKIDNNFHFHGCIVVEEIKG